MSEHVQITLIIVVGGVITMALICGAVVIYNVRDQVTEWFKGL